MFSELLSRLGDVGQLDAVSVLVLPQRSTASAIALVEPVALQCIMHALCFLLVQPNHMPAWRSNGLYHLLLCTSAQEAD
jgi:hypothetical protein